MQQQIIQMAQNASFQHPVSSSISINPHDPNQILKALQSSFYVLFLHYQPYLKLYEDYIKLGILFFLMYVFYKLGGMTVSDRVFRQKEELRSLIEKKNSVQQQVPKKISKIKSQTNRLVILFILLGGGYAYAFYTGHQVLLKDFQNPIIIGGSLIIIYLIYSNIEKVILGKRLKQVNKLQHNISKKLNQFTNSLGPKVISILRNHLCRELQLKYHSSKTINECQKQDCKEFRGLLKQRNDAIGSLVEETVDFEWCTVCKKRSAFDEYLHFEAKKYNQPECQNEQIEIKNKVGYLVDGLDRMKKWLTETSPCNCSKLYWTTSTKQIIQFKKAQKFVGSKMKQLDQKNDK